MGSSRSVRMPRDGLIRTVENLGGRASVTSKKHLLVHGPRGSTTVAPSTLDGSPRGVRNVAAQLRRIGLAVTNEQVGAL